MKNIKTFIFVFLLVLANMLLCHSMIKHVSCDIIAEIRKHSVHPKYGNYTKEVGERKCMPWDDCEL